MKMRSFLLGVTSVAIGGALMMVLVRVATLTCVPLSVSCAT
jgi:hypothetical protein